MHSTGRNWNFHSRPILGTPRGSAQAPQLGIARPEVGRAGRMGRGGQLEDHEIHYKQVVFHFHVSSRESI